MKSTDFELISYDISELNFNEHNYTELINFKIFKYNNHTEYRFYEKPILKNVEKSIEKTKYYLIDGKQINVDTGEIRSDKSIEHSKKSSMNRTINNIYELAFANNWEYFFTFTFSPDKVDRYNYEECYKKLSKFLNNLKNKKCPELKYLVVPEQHKDGAWHFHALILGISFDMLVDSGHKVGNYTIYNFPCYRLGFSSVTLITDTNRVSNYITKYITKELCSTISKHRYLASKNLNRAVVEEHYLPLEQYESTIVDKLTLSSYVKEVKIENAGQKITYIHT